jgi:hypothetical protein
MRSLGRFFSNIGRGVGSFFSNIAKSFVNFISTAVSAGIILSILFPHLAPLMLVLYSAAISAVAVGFDVKWLQIAIAIVAAVISVYQLATLSNAGLGNGWIWRNLPTVATDLITQNSGMARLLMIGASVFFTASYVRSVEEGITIGEALEASAYDLGSTVVGIGSGLIGGVIDGAVGGLFGSGSLSGLLVMAGLAYVTYRVLTAESPTRAGDVTVVTQPLPTNP